MRPASGFCPDGFRPWGPQPQGGSAVHLGGELMSAPVPEIISELLTTKKVPALSGGEMENLCTYPFQLRNFDKRITIAEIAYNNHDDPQALNIFLTCTMPLAQRMAERRAGRIFVHPTDWQLEAMYEGTVAQPLGMFEASRPLQSGRILIGG